MKIRDDFAGPGGWEEGARLLGIHESIIGVEHDANACATARAAGHARIRDDVQAIPAKPGSLDGYIASPPCQTFSAAGKGTGRSALSHLLYAVALVADGASPTEAVAQVHDDALDERSVLVLHPLVVIRDARPRWVALEQVPAVLPVWEKYADWLRTWGYSVATGVLHSEQYGVPQTRDRAVLVASLDREVSLPSPTHSRFHRRDRARLDAGVLPWVSMAEALGGPPMAPPSAIEYVNGNQAKSARRPMDTPAPTVHFGARMNQVDWQQRSRQSVAGVGRATRDAEEPSVTISTHPHEWQQRSNYSTGSGGGRTAEERGRTTRALEEPSTTVTSKGFQWEPVAAVEGDTSWVEERPSPTIVGSFAPDVVAAPGYRKPGDPPRQRTPGSVRVTVQEAGVLQSFPADYPWQGSKSAQYQQVGNAIPPLLAAAILRQVL